MYASRSSAALVILLPFLWPLPASACSVSVEGDGTDQRFGYNWSETEGDWRGFWQPVNRQAKDGQYTALWHKKSESARATLQLHFDRNALTVLRTQAEGTCHYNGTTTRDGWHVTGFYTCTWHRLRLPFRATIGTGRPPPPVPGC